MVILDIGYEPPEKKNILVVDDEIAIQSVFLDAFADQHFVHSSHDGRGGLKLALELQPDLIFMDVMLPGMNGHEVVKLLSVNKATKNIPVIIITARDFEPTTIGMLRNEPNVRAFLQKPFHVAELREMVRLIFEK